MNLVKPLIQSIRFRIVGLLLLCLIPPTLGGIFLLDWYTEKQLMKIAQKNLQDHARLMTQSIARLDTERRHDVAFIAAQPEVIALESQKTNSLLDEFVRIYSWQGYPSSLNSANSLLNNFSRFHPWEGSFTVTNNQGKIVAQNSNLPQSLALPLPAWLKEIQIRKRYINRLLKGRNHQESMDCLVMPIYTAKTQEHIGAVVECIPLKTISNFISDLAKTVDIGRILLVNYQGYVYADTNKSEYTKLENIQSVPYIQKLLNNHEGLIYNHGNFIYLAPIHLRGSLTWGLLLENTEATVRAAIVDINEIGFFLVLIIGAIVAYASWQVIHHSTIPILELTQASQAIARGDLDYKINVKGEDEIGTLANSFQYMTDQLKALIAQEVKDEIYRLELEKGRQIQQDFLPASLPKPQGWQINAVFEPARSVSGDFYDAFLLDNDHLGLAIGDVCDKGVGAAMFMGLFRSLLRVFSGAAVLDDLSIQPSILGSSFHDPETQLRDDPEIIQKFLRAVHLTNDYIAIEHSSMAMFATLFFGILNIKTGYLTYINAGHEPLYLLNSSGIKHWLKATSPAVGMIPHSVFFIHEIALKTGDMLIGYTDGVTDARSPAGEFFGRQRLEALLQQNYAAKVQVLELIKAALIDHINDSIQFDDITMLAIVQS